MTTAVVVALGLTVALLSILVVGLLRSHAEILKALHDLGVNLEDGSPESTRTAVAASRHPPGRTADGVARPRAGGAGTSAPDLTGDLPGGGAVHVAVAGVPHTTMLAFLSTGCGTCSTFWDALNAGVTRLPDPTTRVVVVTNGADSESPAAVADLAPPDLVTLMSDQAWSDYGVPVSPYFILVDGQSSRVVGEGAGTSWEQVVDLLAKSTADSATPPGPGRRRAAPSGQDRADRVDRELRAAGIEQGDPSLYPDAHASLSGEDPR